MTAVEHPLEQWLTGVTLDPSDRAGAGQIVVAQSGDQLAELARGDLLDEDSRCYVREMNSGHTVAALPAAVHSFSGNLVGVDGDVILDDGYRLQVRQYGTGEFVCFDAPTVLRIADADDVSAFLRDADQAWATGVFAHHVTHPNAIIPDLAGLGGNPDRSGPEQRLFVFPDSRISTSPTGHPLGTVASSRAEVGLRWREANQASAFPDAVCLGRVVDERDRIDALRERPWIARYVLVAMVIRTIRREHRVLSAASGFRSRITPGLPVPESSDPVDAPVVLKIGHEFSAHDPTTVAVLRISGRQLALVEALLAFPARADVLGWSAAPLGLPTDTAHRAVIDLLEAFSDARVASTWCAEVRARWGN